jgi:tRNA(fMet)-specific endonuclease VapC
MSVYLLDTDHVSLVQHGHPFVNPRINSHPATDVAISAITIQEQMTGWQGRLNRLRTPPQIADWYLRLVDRIFPVWGQFPLLSFTEPAVLRFQHLRSLRLNIGMMDLRIAAIALENGLIVVTRNRRDFGRVPGLITEDWSI